MYYRPPEWQKNKIFWLAWPYDKNLWQENLEIAQGEFIELVRSLKNERLIIIFPDQAKKDAFTKLIDYKNSFDYKFFSYADIWLRDTAPIFVKDKDKKNYAVIPKFNGWGNKYLLQKDIGLSSRIADELKLNKIASDIVFEGGAIDYNGEGVILTTEQCLLNPNRNPNIKKHQVEEEFSRLFGAKKTIWLKQGLLNDHTDGHVDTIARFVSSNEIAVMLPESKSDPNYQSMCEINQTLENQIDLHGKKFKIISLPSPGKIIDSDGEIMPASYLNFIIGDRTVVVPVYDTIHDEAAVNILQSHFSDREVIGVKARAILSGGGAFHCISQEFFE